MTSAIRPAAPIAISTQTASSSRVGLFGKWNVVQQHGLQPLFNLQASVPNSNSGNRRFSLSPLA